MRTQLSNISVKTKQAFHGHPAEYNRMQLHKRVQPTESNLNPSARNNGSFAESNKINNRL